MKSEIQIISTFILPTIHVFTTYSFMALPYECLGNAEIELVSDMMSILALEKRRMTMS